MCTNILNLHPVLKYTPSRGRSSELRFSVLQRNAHEHNNGFRIVVEVWLQPFLNSTIDGGTWLVKCRYHFNCKESLRILFVMKLGFRAGLGAVARRKTSDSTEDRTIILYSHSACSLVTVVYWLSRQVFSCYVGPSRPTRIQINFYCNIIIDPFSIILAVNGNIINIFFRFSPLLPRPTDIYFFSSLHRSLQCHSWHSCLPQNS